MFITQRGHSPEERSWGHSRMIPGKWSSSLPLCCSPVKLWSVPDSLGCPCFRSSLRWRYGFNSILEVHIRHCNQMWSWSNIKKHRENLKAYKTAYKTRLLNQNRSSPDTERQIQVRMHERMHVHTHMNMQCECVQGQGLEKHQWSTSGHGWVEVTSV